MATAAGRSASWPARWWRRFRGGLRAGCYRDVAREISEADLRQAAALDIGDWFRFEIGPPRPLAGTGGVRLP